MEKHEYQDDTVPRHVANFLRQRIEEKALRQIEKSERPHMDDDEMRQVEPGQQFDFTYISPDSFSNPNKP